MFIDEFSLGTDPFTSKSSTNPLFFLVSERYSFFSLHFGLVALMPILITLVFFLFHLKDGSKVMANSGLSE